MHARYNHRALGTYTVWNRSSNCISVSKIIPSSALHQPRAPHPRLPHILICFCQDGVPRLFRIAVRCLTIRSMASSVRACFPSSRVAVLLFGALRDMEHTLPTWAHLLVPLQAQAGVPGDVHMHVMLTEAMVNERNGEDGRTNTSLLTHEQISAEIDRRLGPACRVALEQQMVVDAREFGWAIRRSWSTRNLNALRKWYSLRQAAQLAEAQESLRGFQYSYVAAIRSDTAIYTRMAPMLPLLASPSTDIIIPNFQHWGGVNDRFALGDRSTMFHMYARQLDSARSLWHPERENTETFLCRLLSQAKLKVTLANICIVRVRSNGLCVQRDLLFLPESKPPQCLPRATLHHNRSHLQANPSMLEPCATGPISASAHGAKALGVQHGQLVNTQCPPPLALRTLARPLPDQTTTVLGDGGAGPAQRPSGAPVVRSWHTLKDKAQTLLSPATIRDAQRVSAGCSRLAFTSIDVDGEPPAIMPPYIFSSQAKDTNDCILVFVGEGTVKTETNGRYSYVTHRRTEATRTMSSRLFSKVPKLSPDVLFPGKWTVFFDTKLWMQVTLDTLWHLFEETLRGQENVPLFTAFEHPECRHLGRGAFEWLQRESHLLLASTTRPAGHGAPPRLRVANATILRMQVKRYVQLARTDAGPAPGAYRAYIDGALIMQQNATELFALWRNETFRSDSSDRDQISFAHAVASRQLPVRLLPAPCVTLSTAVTYCHWYKDRSVALLRRTDFIESRLNHSATFTAR